MQRRNRSPGLVMLLIVGLVLMCTPVISGELAEGQTSTVADYEAQTASGVSVEAKFSTGTVAESSCRNGKRTIATSSNFVFRAGLKALVNDCHDCCSENTVFSDGFENGSTSNWSSTVG